MVDHYTRGMLNAPRQVEVWRVLYRGISRETKANFRGFRGSDGRIYKLLKIKFLGCVVNWRLDFPT